MAKAAPQRPRPDPRTVQCYHCRHRFPVGSRTMTTSCPSCSKPLLVDDVIVKSIQSVRKIQTCGRIVVHKNARVIAQFVEAHQGVEVEGIMEANVLSGGPVRIHATAQWKGDCNAPTVSIADGCRIAGGRFQIPDTSLGVEDLL